MMGITPSLAHKTFYVQSFISFPFPWLNADKHSDGGSCVLKMAEPQGRRSLGPSTTASMGELPDQEHLHYPVVPINSYCVKLLKFCFSSKHPCLNQSNISSVVLHIEGKPLWSFVTSWDVVGLKSDAQSMGNTEKLYPERKAELWRGQMQIRTLARNVKSKE